ncbi:MAG TPA: hypothetical protein VMH79_16590 [Thermoanaerobaculia bacterium]|nr:hypothetical protein [Thermoanaerobaculia bacterium]
MGSAAGGYSASASGRIFKFGRLPVKIQLAGQYIVTQPDPFGQLWNIQIQLTPVLPKLSSERAVAGREFKFGADMAAGCSGSPLLRRFLMHLHQRGALRARC